MDESLEENNSELVLGCIKIADSRISSSTAKATQSMASESAAILLSCFSASWVYSKVVVLGVSFFEHEHRYKDAINLLKRLLACFPCDGRRGYWTLRLSIDLEHIGCPNESLSIAEDGLLDVSVRAGSKIALQRRVLRLGKPPRRWKAPSFSYSIRRKIKEVHIQGRPLNHETGKKSRFYGEDGEQCGVEQLALQYYAGEGGGWNGVHSESGIWLTIFGLLMWDIIFSDVPNVFLNRFQGANYIKQGNLNICFEGGAYCYTFGIGLTLDGPTKLVSRPNVARAPSSLMPRNLKISSGSLLSTSRKKIEK
ncbi:hypothetical protein RCOM_1749140 [Ricinus communis]|uniref:Fanconi-associated nuclease n=1 Tax=Ricinus communis TaxID=3988 RepID=B9RWV7_RICCO|nr:hypothetical protein RCOM_1749140 [Ricinus communis]